MSSFLFIFAILLYGVILAILFAFGMNFLYLAIVTARSSQKNPIAPPVNGNAGGQRASANL